MSKMQPRMPFYIKYFTILGALFLTAYGVILLRSIVTALLLAFIFSLGLSPICKLFDKILPRILSSICCILLLFIILGLILLLVMQITNINFDFYLLFDKIGNVIDGVKSWAADKLSFSIPKETDYFKAAINTLGKDITKYFNFVISITTGFITSLVLFVISLFFFLYYRNFFIAFLYKISAEKNHHDLKRMIVEIENIIKRYTMGLGMVILIVATLNIIGLLIIGTPHAFYFGFLGAVLLVIPYIGILIGATLPTLYMFVTTNSIWYPLAVIFVFAFVQFLEGNFITPNIVGDKIGLNPFVIILGIFLGGMLLGLVGILLIVPLLGIMKIIFDNIPSLAPIGFLMGKPPKSL